MVLLELLDFSKVKSLIEDQILTQLNFIFILCYILGGYLGKSSKLKIFSKISSRIKTMVLGTILSAIYAIIVHIEGNPIPLGHIFWSYLVATTICYDLVIKYIEKKFSNNSEGYTELTYAEKSNLELNLLDPDMIIHQTDEKKGFYKLNEGQTNWIFMGTKLK